MSKQDWKWFGNAGHYICSNNCRFHLTTLIGNYVISTVGEHVLPNANKSPKQSIFEEIGYKRLYETMVFKASGDVCEVASCNCGLPDIVADQIDFIGSNNAGCATTAHMQLCDKYEKIRLLEE